MGTGKRAASLPQDQSPTLRAVPHGHRQKGCLSTTGPVTNVKGSTTLAEACTGKQQTCVVTRRDPSGRQANGRRAAWRQTRRCKLFNQRPSPPSPRPARHCHWPTVCTGYTARTGTRGTTSLSLSRGTGQD